MSTTETKNPLQDKLEAANAHISSLSDNVRELGAFRGEALALRDELAATKQKLADAQRVAEQAVHEASSARGEASGHVSARAVEASDVAHARALAQAIKHFLG